MEIKETSLINLHKQYGAKLVEFAGYNMPIQYSEGILSEHKFTRSNCGIFDVSHMGQLFIYGKEDLTKELEKIFPTDLQSLKTNQSKYSFLMNEKGGICDDLIITKIKKGYMIILNAACKVNDFKILKKKLDISYKIELKEDLSLIALQGPGAKNILGKVIPEITNLRFMHGGEFNYNDLKIYITRSGYTGEDGFEISICTEQAEVFVRDLLENKNTMLCGLGSRDSLRLEAGLSLYGHELNENITPIEAGLSWALDKDRLNDSSLNGNQILSAQLNNNPANKKIGLVSVNRAMLRDGMILSDSNHNKIGKITSGCFSPNLNKSIALGYVNSEFNLESKIFCEIRNKMELVERSKLPFVKKNYKKKGVTDD